MPNFLDGKDLIDCISCDLCAPVCPMKVGISGSFSAMNHYLKTADLDWAKEIEKSLVTDKGLKKAKECICCGRCEKHCPRRIKIRDHLLDISKIIK
jgi:predicted aldo/keto reductase-like oxidoreductase